MLVNEFKFLRDTAHVIMVRRTKEIDIAASHNDLLHLAIRAWEGMQNNQGCMNFADKFRLWGRVGVIRRTSLIEFPSPNLLFFLHRFFLNR